MSVVNLPLYRKPPVAPVDIPNAYYGVANTLPRNHNSIVAALPERLTIITDQTINLTVDPNQYGWFYIRAEVENVRFMDLAVQLYGGWDGATWPDDGETLGDTSGPMIITDGEGNDWHLFRTDFPAIGSRTYRVSFTAPEEETPPPPPPPPVDTPPTTAIFGVGVLAQPYVESAVRAMLTSTHTYDTSGQEFTINITADNFGYFAVPANKNPVFIDVSSGFPGGWDGASWDNEGNIGGETGPVAITIAGAAWKLYRTDFTSVGNKTFRVNY